MIDTPYITLEQLTTQDRDLLDAATKAMEGAYNPYSNFFVGAALRISSGLIITGHNIENASFPATICAERVTVYRADAMDYRDYDAMAIITRGANFDTDEPSMS